MTGLAWACRAGVLLAAIVTGSAEAAVAPDLIAELDQIRVEADVAGLGLVLVVGDQTDVQTLGLADREGRRPFRANDYIRLGSVTKSFTGLAFIAAQREALVDLDQPIAPTAELFTNPWHPEYPVTLSSLLEHTAGLKDLSQKEWDHNTPVDLNTALAVDPGSRRLAWPPGLYSVYSNSGAGVAARVFELRTGQSFEAWLKSAVFDPMGLESATFDLSDEVRRDLITGYNTDGRTPIPYWHMLYRPFGGINIRLAEMRRFLKTLLDDADGPFSANERLRFEQPQSTLAARDGLAFGYGLGNYTRINHGVVWHGHGGDADGYLSVYGYNRELGKGYFLIINAFQGRTLRRLRDRVEAYLAAGERLSFEPPQPRPRAQLIALTGIYREAATRFGQPGGQVEIRLDEGRLWLHEDGRRSVLLPLASGHFRRPDEPVATTAFVRHGKQMVLQGPARQLRPGDRSAASVIE